MYTKYELKKISKTMSYALRHNPREFGIDLDSEGYCKLDDFIENLNSKRNLGLSRKVIDEIIKNSEKKRFEIKDDLIRACYGHSRVNIEVEKTAPPDILYHGTSHKALESIKKQGLLPMQRQFVHLSSSMDVAINVGKRRDGKPVVLKVDSKRAYEDNIGFYYGNDTTWLSESIPFEYIEIIKQ